MPATREALSRQMALLRAHLEDRIGEAFEVNVTIVDSTRNWHSSGSRSISYDI